MAGQAIPSYKIWLVGLGAGLVGALVGAGIVVWSSGYFVRSYLLENPQILPEAMDQLRSRETSETVDRHREAIETPFHGAWAGAADGDVVLVAFFDYACGYCRAANADVDRLLREDPRLKVVWRDYPVLGPDSEQAAIASLAAAKAGRFQQFYRTLFATARPSETARTAALAAVGLPQPELTDEFRAELTQNYRLAQAIGATGTPTFVVGDQLLEGAVGYQALRDAIAQARSRT